MPRGPQTRSLFLYDPRTNVLTPTTYEEISGIQGTTMGTLRSVKSQKKKVPRINCYLVDDTITLKQRREWYEKEYFVNETWAVIEGSDDCFLVSNYGRFKRLYQNGKEKMLLPYFHTRKNVMQVKLRFKGKYSDQRVAQIVAYHFVEGPAEEGMVVHHKNLIKTDNFSGNLEYIKRDVLGKKTGGIAKSRPVVQLNKDTLEYVDEFRSAREAGRKCFVSYQSVMDCCNHKYKTSGGLWVFMWTDEYEVMTGGIEIEHTDESIYTS